MDNHLRDRRTPVQFAALPRLERLPPKIDPSAMPGWELEFSCHGRPFRCFVRAMTIRSAEPEARLQLSYHDPAFESSEARLVKAMQVRT